MAKMTTRKKEVILLRAIYNEKEVGKEGIVSASLQSRLLRRKKFDVVGMTYCVRVEDVNR